nr:MAG TPA: hypothetical protein [Caudoviricetes sp.]
MTYYSCSTPPIICIITKNLKFIHIKSKVCLLCYVSVSNKTKRAD